MTARHPHRDEHDHGTRQDEPHEGAGLPQRHKARFRPDPAAWADAVVRLG